MATKLSETTRIAYRSMVGDIEMDYSVSLDGGKATGGLFARLKRGDSRLGILTLDALGTLTMTATAEVRGEEMKSLLDTFLADTEQIKKDLEEITTKTE